MTETLSIWLFGGSFGLIGVLFALWYAHTQHCLESRSNQARSDEKIERLQEDIGDHNKGIRGELHIQAQKITEHEMRLEVLDRKKQ